MSQTKVSKIIFSLLVGCSTLGAKELPPTMVQANRINVRQIEGGGIGYGQGYTTLEAFLTSFKNADSWLPFLDLRAHRFDNDKYAFNAGFGVRSFSDRAIWGVNAYYDYRQTRHRNYKQVGVGVEVLGCHWDFRMNGYIPVGGRESGIYQTKFDKFKGHTLIVKAKREFDMGGANAEAAYHWMPTDNIDITGALGPYYFRGKYNQFAAGGQARVKATFLNAISLEGIGSYDNLFKWNGQGQLTFSIPLGPKLKTQTKCHSRIAQPVQRFEIIVADSHKKSQVAINPATGLPFNFVFVNNDPSTTPNGTFENPYLTLATAQSGSAPGDIIYVYGSNTVYTVAAPGFTMQNNQKLWGSAIPHSLQTSIGSMTVPPLTTVTPALNANVPLATFSTVNLGNNNEVSGFYFPSVNGVIPALPIFGFEITGALIQNNNFNLNSTGTGTFAMAFQNCNGPLMIRNNLVTISDMLDDSAIALFNTVPLSGTVSIMNNTFIGNGNINSLGINFGNTSTSPLLLFVQGNTFNQWGEAIGLTSNGSLSGNIVVTNNSINDSPVSGNAWLAINFSSTGTFEFDISDNSFTNNGGAFAFVGVTGGVTASGQINNNLFQGNTGTNDLQIETDATSSLCLQLNYNVFDLPTSFLGDPPTGPFNLQTPIGNTGPLVIDPSVTIVPPGTCP